MVIRFDWGTPMYDQSIFLRDLVLRKPLNMEFTASELIKERKYIHLAYIDYCYNMKACLYLLRINTSVLQLKQMAVSPTSQKKGYGRLLVNEAENLAKQYRCKKIVLHAREEAVGFYSKLGYKKVSKKFAEIGIPHFKMEKTF